MKMIFEFGSVDNPGEIDFEFQADNPDMIKILEQSRKPKKFQAYVGTGKFNKKEIKGFYPRGTQDQLAYYATQFNSIEMNASFYRLFPPEQFDAWYQAVPSGFRYFPKLEQLISHYRRLKDVKEIVAANVANMSHLREKLEMVFLQLHNNFCPREFDRVVQFVENWKYDVPLAMEFRHTDWFNDPTVSDKLAELLEANNITNIIIDTPGRRDLLHMRLTTPIAFIRWVGADHAESDNARLDSWVERISQWKKAGLQKLYFFVHQNPEHNSVALAAYFIERLNKKIGTKLQVPKLLEPNKDQPLS